ncbi:MAG: adenylate/guanylate cyclase domain-containing protein, partial [Chloroflexi bacterium]|nr:adenylate/guanylate cyclase domain-containing protein [Chloroflexota bacterium]
MSRLPTGTVTFLFTDIEGSTRLIQELGDARSRQVFADYRRILLSPVQAVGGHLWEDQGESFLFVFEKAKDALQAAVAAQRTLTAHVWPDGANLRVRMGLHTGEPVGTVEGYVGVDVHRVARICQAGHGGQILLSQTTHHLVEYDPQVNVRLRDLGAHRLKDLQRPEKIFQLLHPDLPVDFPVLRTLDSLPNNLPRQLTSFVGREREMTEIKGLLAIRRLLTLTGFGGCGKTRLALQVAADVAEEYPEGVWLAELADVSDPADVPQVVASALGVREEPGRTLTATLSDYLHQRRLLLVLDNCEHVIAACAQLGQTLLSASPRLRILAT